VTPDAVPEFEISAVVKLEASIASEKVIVKLAGSELTELTWPEALANELTDGALPSWVYDTRLVHEEVLPALSTALP
jgi:hypothetical protein